MCFSGVDIKWSKADRVNNSSSDWIVLVCIYRLSINQHSISKF